MPLARSLEMHYARSCGRLMRTFAQHTMQRFPEDTMLSFTELTMPNALSAWIVLSTWMKYTRLEVGIRKTDGACYGLL